MNHLQRFLHIFSREKVSQGTRLVVNPEQITRPRSGSRLVLFGSRGLVVDRQTKSSIES